jgi:hypothetical protein
MRVAGWQGGMSLVLVGASSSVAREVLLFRLLGVGVVRSVKNDEQRWQAVYISCDLYARMDVQTNRISISPSRRRPRQL